MLFLLLIDIYDVREYRLHSLGFEVPTDAGSVDLVRFALLKASSSRPRVVLLCGTPVWDLNTDETCLFTFV